MISDQIQTILKAIEDKNQALIQENDLFNQRKIALNQTLRENIDYVKHSTEKIINEIMCQSHEFQLGLKEKCKNKIDKIDQFLTENSKCKNFVVSIENDIQSCLNIIKSQSNVIYDNISNTKRVFVKKWEDFLLNYNITQIDKNKQHFINQEKVIVDFRYINNRNKKVFSCKSLSINDKDIYNNDNKENLAHNKERSAFKNRQFLKVFQMSSNSTNVNTNNYSLNNQTQRDTLIKHKSESNQKVIEFNN